MPQPRRAAGHAAPGQRRVRLRGGCAWEGARGCACPALLLLCRRWCSSCGPALRRGLAQAGAACWLPLRCQPHLSHSCQSQFVPISLLPILLRTDLNACRGPGAPLLPGRVQGGAEHTPLLICVNPIPPCRTAEDPGRRYNLGEFKEELMEAMGLNTEGEGSAMAFLRRGYKARAAPRCPAAAVFYRRGGKGRGGGHGLPAARLQRVLAGRRAAGRVRALAQLRAQAVAAGAPCAALLPHTWPHSCSGRPTPVARTPRSHRRRPGGRTTPTRSRARPGAAERAGGPAVLALMSALAAGAWAQPHAGPLASACHGLLRLPSPP